MSDAYHVPLKFKISRPILKAVIRGVFHVLGRVKITGKENIPYGKPYVAAMNHVSIFDPPFAGAFWPENMERGVWESEVKAFCRGVGHGPRVTRQEIEAAMQLKSAHDLELDEE